MDSDSVVRIAALAANKKPGVRAGLDDVTDPSSEALLDGLTATGPTLSPSSVSRRATLANYLCAFHRLFLLKTLVSPSTVKSVSASSTAFPQEELAREIRDVPCLRI